MKVAAYVSNSCPGLTCLTCLFYSSFGRRICEAADLISLRDHRCTDFTVRSTGGTLLISRGVVYNRNWKKFLIARDWRLLCAYVNRGSLLISVDSDYSELMQSFLFGSGIANEPASTTQPVSLRAESCSAVQIRPAVDGPQIHYFGRVRLKSSYTVYIKGVLRPNLVTSWMYNLIDWFQPRWRRPWKRTSSSSGDSSWPLVLSSRFFSSSKVLPHVCSSR
ncbi:hypothetical protein T05_6857 [Trichinella murrelli]|uniref:Uncharacterized protein n=1 Tax=Trichinella murrelli TaxID=144512 RepID=A0A0V0TB21_9BILA|nr:hypothetical protein T05_6857 [Trichinella murrelli]